MKLCCTCKAPLPAEAFGPDKQTKDGLRKRCRECHRRGNAESRARNLEASREATRRWQKANRDKANAKQRRWMDSNPGRMAELQAAYRGRNKDELRRVENERRSAPEIRLIRSIGQRMRNVLSGKGGCKTSDLVGYAGVELRAHIERQFLKGMSWDNYGDWHVDHIVPLSSFKFTGPNDHEVRRAWALTNLRPLWSSDNLRKHSKRTHLI